MSERRALGLGLLVLILYFLPFVVLGECHYMLIHDYLDSNVAHMKAIDDAGAWLDGDALLPILGGIPRSDFGSALNLKFLFFALLPMYWGSVANLFLIKLTALLGLFFLLRRRILPQSSVLAALLASVAFMLVPFNPDYGVSSAGIPLLALAFFELFDRSSGFWRKAAAFAAVVYFGAFSSLVLSGVFAGLVLGVVFLAVLIRGKRFCWPALAALVALGGVYVAGNWPLIESFFAPSEGGEVMHRVEFVTPGVKLIGEMFATFAISQYHAGSFMAVAIVTAFLVVARKDRSETARWLKLSLACLAGLIAAGYLSMLLLSGVSIFREFQFCRFYFLYPGLCFVLLAYVISCWTDSGRRGALSALLAVVVVFGLVQDSNVRNEFSRLAGKEPSFREYYDTDLFARVKDAVIESEAEDGFGVGDDQAMAPKVACLGFVPAIAEYNGFWTVDGYFFSYPLSYKHSWRPVIAGELDKDPALAAYFDGWGSRCYLFSSELGSRPRWDKRKVAAAGEEGPLKDLSIDVTALSALGCGHILSAVPIPAAESSGLSCRGEFEGRWWKIWLYRID